MTKRREVANLTSLRAQIGEGDYVGLRVEPFQCEVYAPNGEPLSPRLGLRDHSPTGFEWGYGGSGPAQLALAILAHHIMDDQEALALYQDFKWAVVARLPHVGWILSPRVIELVIREIKEGGDIDGSA